MHSFAHSYLDHTLKSRLAADSSALVPKCHMELDTSALVPYCRMDISEPVPNCPDISDSSQWCRNVLCLKCLDSAHPKQISLCLDSFLHVLCVLLYTVCMSRFVTR